MIVYSKLLAGHRREYLELIGALFDCKKISGNLNFRNLMKLFSDPLVVFSTIDDDYIQFLMISSLRALVGKKTVGLFLRPHTCFHVGLKFRLKRRLFMFLKNINKISVITIMDHKICPDFEIVSDGSIVDLHCWDLIGCNDAEEAVLNCKTNFLFNDANSDGKHLILFPGTVTKSKGLSKLLDLVGIDSFRDNYFLILAGKVENEAVDIVNELKYHGSLSVNSFVPRSVLFSLMRQSTYVWCHYDAAYDQASGFVGRALQLGATPLVRKGSYSQKFCILHNIPFAILNEELCCIERFDGISSEDVKKLCTLWRQEFVNWVM